MLPDVGCAPLQPPDAMQLCAFFALHESVIEVPGTTEFEFDCSATAGLTGALVLPPFFSIAVPLHAARASRTQEAKSRRIWGVTRFFIVSPWRKQARAASHFVPTYARDFPRDIR